MDLEKTDAVHDEGAEHQLAHLINQEDHEKSKWQTINSQPRAFAWCIFAVWTILLVSFENQAGDIVVSIPQFRKDFGSYFEDDYVLETTWKARSAEIADLIGRRNTLVISLAISYAAVSLEFISTTYEMFFGGKGRDEQALRSLKQLELVLHMERTLKRLANIKAKLEEIRQETEGVTYLECFRKSNLRRTIVYIAPLIIQQFTGIVFAASYSTYYAQVAGYSTDMSFKLQVTQQVLSMGTVVLTIVFWVMGGLAVGGSQEQFKAAVAMILLYCFFYNTIGAMAYTCLTETATSRLRIKTIVIGLASANSIGVMWSFVLPYLYNPDRANLGGKLGFIFGGLCFSSIAFIWWFQPETRKEII
ncbi:hypothetical protein BDV12DRAFT_196587 [Aspergillus spectabilis]